MLRLEKILQQIVEHDHSEILSLLIFEKLTDQELLNVVRTLILAENREILHFLKFVIPQEMFWNFEK